MVIVNDTLSDPGHERYLICTWEAAIKLGGLVGVLETNVVSDELGHLSQESWILVMDDPSRWSIHASHLESAGS